MQELLNKLGFQLVTGESATGKEVVLAVFSACTRTDSKTGAKTPVQYDFVALRSILETAEAQALYGGVDTKDAKRAAYARFMGTGMFTLLNKEAGGDAVDILDHIAGLPQPGTHRSFNPVSMCLSRLTVKQLCSMTGEQLVEAERGFLQETLKKVQKAIQAASDPEASIEGIQKALRTRAVSDGYFVRPKALPTSGDADIEYQF